MDYRARGGQLPAGRGEAGVGARDTQAEAEADSALPGRGWSDPVLVWAHSAKWEPQDGHSWGCTFKVTEANTSPSAHRSAMT